MDPTQIKKIHTMKMYKRRHFLENLYFYSLIALTCSLFCCATLCIPYLYSLVRLFFSVYFSSLISDLLSSKLLFIIGNLIILVLIVNSRILSSSNSTSTTSDVYYDEYVQSRQIKKYRHEMPPPQIKKSKTIDEKHGAENYVDMNNLDLKDKGWGKRGTIDTWPDKEEDDDDDDIGEGEELSLVYSSDELNKRAEDFIARVNRQRRLELSHLQFGNGSY